MKIVKRVGLAAIEEREHKGHKYYVVHLGDGWNKAYSLCEAVSLAKWIQK